ncbi:MAG: M15 family metallopeptidase [Bacilli bacterium]|nr:M15 family metallopeptidase [Bacilli bacterium]
MYTLVNKYNYLNKDYVPDNLVNVTGMYARDKAELVNVAYDNFVKMADDARKSNLTIKITTGYRSYNFQSTLYNNYVKVDGVKNADTYSARPGYSEHQLGYSADLTNAKNVAFDDFENTDEYKWLKDNAHKYGFIMRYPKAKEYITGYMFESWHYRYVGIEIATYIYENNITYEEYYAYFLR